MQAHLESHLTDHSLIHSVITTGAHYHITTYECWNLRYLHGLDFLPYSFTAAFIALCIIDPGKLGTLGYHQHLLWSMLITKYKFFWVKKLCYEAGLLLKPHLLACFYCQGLWIKFRSSCGFFALCLSVNCSCAVLGQELLQKQMEEEDLSCLPSLKLADIDRSIKPEVVEISTLCKWCIYGWKWTNMFFSVKRGCFVSY